MIHKLLNFSKNLIISLGLVVIIMMLFFTTSSYAVSGFTLGSVMRQTISVWYLYILRISISVYVIGYLIIVLKLLVDRTPERLKILKESIWHFIIMFIIIYLLHYIMIAIITLNGEGLNIAKNVGSVFSGIDMENDEYDLYETALSKAYELGSVPGTIGLIMYLLLVYYTYKFAFVYLKRYINVVVLILLAPIIFVSSTIKKIITGISDGKIGKWFKEFIFNVIIQTFHAIFYAILIGLTLRMSDNDENLIGALLTLIVFGFIFKIDEIIRKVFNFVGGSTKISKSKAVGEAWDTVGGAIDGGISGMGESIKQLPSNVKQKAIATSFDIKNKAIDAYNNAKINVKDYQNILNGERVKANLTAEELIAAQHDLSENKGIIGLRNKVQHASTAISTKVGKAGNVAGKRLEKIYATVDGRTKLAISNVQEQMKHDVDMLENNVEMTKRVYNVIRKLFKKKKMKLIKNENGMNVDVTNTMMLVVDTEVSPEEFMASVREQLGEGMDIGVYVFENIGAQVFLSSALGSPRMGMAVLAEENYEKVANHRIEGIVTGNKRKKRTIKKASRRVSKREIRRAGRTIKRDKENFRKTYKFSRFNPKTSRKITKRMLKKSRQQNRYIVVINKAYDDIQINNMRARGVISKKTTKISREVRATRKNVVRSVRKIKLMQRQAIEQYRSVEKKTRRIEIANKVAYQFMTAKNIVRLGFKQIDQMTPGQIGLRKMIKEGKAKELSNGLIAVRNTATVQEKVRATGIVKAKDKNLVLQFVVGQSGELFKQIVTTEGKIVQPAVDAKGKVVQSIANLEEQVIQPRAKGRKHAEPKVHATGQVDQVIEASAEQTIQKVVTFDGKVVEQVINSDGMIDATSYKIVHEGGEKLVAQVQSVITNEDIGLAETATAEEKVQKLETLLEDIKRESDTQPLLEQILEQSTPEERELDEILVSAMEKVGISSMPELKQHMFLDESVTPNEEFIQKTNRFKSAITEKMIDAGVITSVEAEDEDTMEKAFQILNTRVETLTATDSDILLDTAAEMERTKIAEQLIAQGKFTEDNPPEDKDIDAKMGSLSQLLSGLAKEYVEETIKFPRSVLGDTAKYTMEVIDNAAKETKTEAELAFEAALEKAEKKWAKKHGKEADESIVEKYKKKENGEDEEKKETVKISLNFFGAVLKQGQTVTLSNRHSIKDFYDKANKLEGANLRKTQERFLQLYGDKLEKMQLMPFSFAKNPVEEMDEWCIYVVTDNEDISQGEKEKEKEKTQEEIRTKDLIDLYYMDIKRIFTGFIMDHEITSFEQLYKDTEAKQDLIRRLRVFLFRQDEKDESTKAKAIVNYLDSDVRFKNIMQETEVDILAKSEGEERRKKAKSTVKVMSKEKAEEKASNRVTKAEAKRIKEETKDAFMKQVLGEVEAQEVEEARETQNEDLKQLLYTLDDIKACVSIDQGNTTRNKKTLEFDFDKKEVMP